MSRKVRWGILSTASIGINKVIPAMLQGQFTSVDAIASRDLQQAKNAAASLGIPKAYGSYEALLADPDIEAVYIPVPNHLHVPWTIKAAEAGKHVLCEKPISLTAAEGQQLLEVRARTGVKIGEAFMVRLHPQWIRLRELLDQNAIGDLRLVSGFFSYFNTDPQNIRNQADIGGGALMDIGCYLVLASRYAFRQEPARVVASIDRDPATQVDRLTSAILEFSNGQAVITCSTQLVPYQRLQILGSKGRIELEIPVNVSPDRPARLHLDSGADLFGGGVATETFPACDQYTLQADAFSKAILHHTEVSTPVEEAIQNMAVIDALFRSARTNRWEEPKFN